MKRRGTTPEATNPSIVSSVRLSRDIPIGEARTFWYNQRKEGNVDVIFKEARNKLELLWHKIKYGSATSQDYVRAFFLVNEEDLGDHCDQSAVEELPEKEDYPPEEPSPIPINTTLEKAEPCSEPESSAVPVSSHTSVPYKKHHCGQACLSNVNPNYCKKENPLKLPVMCQFQRRHSKSGRISRQQDVIYKAPCGKSLRNLDDVYSYLFETKCRFLSLDHFSFDTYLQLDRYLVKNKVVFQEADISQDAELVPVPLCNEIDNSRPAPFTYRKSPWPRAYVIHNFTDLFLGCCDCIDGCLDVSKCACLQLTARKLGKDEPLLNRRVTPGYKHKRLQTPVPTGLYECNVSCKCDRKMCQNRVVQHGIQVRLQVFKTTRKGWGVRCLDDLDKGTFVCIYAGRILMKIADVNISQDSVMQTCANKTASIHPIKKSCSSHSDSEITALPSVSNIGQTFGITPQIWGISKTKLKRKRFSRLKEGKLDITSIKRPKTRTSVLQKCRQQLMKEGRLTMQHSSDDDLFTPPPSRQIMHPGKCEDTDENIEMTSTTRGNRDLNDEVGYVSVESSSSILHGTKENSDRPESNIEEMIYYLDASSEGNIGRFLNHSCCPNLFVQQVFVETHYKQFPWVAFFTKSFVKAGTELTWEYNYDSGSILEKEISCLCGHKTCKNVIV
ncbi:histone methyltransferase activity (H3-K9 specific) [Pristimantis euphronides]